uniref:Uncharacterized protein n=1 Tax=Ditylenchus dipsaci TaxID=166011 RepID=A0A915E9L6_9BILA
MTTILHLKKPKILLPILVCVVCLLNIVACSPPVCGDNEEFKEDGCEDCDNTCLNPEKRCVCITRRPECKCKSGFVRHCPCVAVSNCPQN